MTDRGEDTTAGRVTTPLPDVAITGGTPTTKLPEIDFIESLQQRRRERDKRSKETTAQGNDSSTPVHLPVDEGVPSWLQHREPVDTPQIDPRVPSWLQQREQVVTTPQSSEIVEPSPVSRGEQKYSRRDVLRLFGSLGAAAWLAWLAQVLKLKPINKAEEAHRSSKSASVPLEPSPTSTSITKHSSTATETVKPTETSIVLPPAFEDKDAQEVANGLGIDLSDFFLFRKATTDKLQAFLSPDLFPIYPPAVLAHKDLIYKYADKYGVSPNVLAAIMSVESAGVEDSQSKQSAQGLFQVMPFNFAPDVQGTPKMQDPDINADTGVSYLVNSCLPVAREDLKNYNPNGAQVYARALMGYNAGPGKIATPFKELPFETQKYGDFFIRFAITAEIADGLRKKGFDDQQIVKKISSHEIDARAYALSMVPFQTYDEYSRALSELIKPVPGGYTQPDKSDYSKEFTNAYQEYLNDQRIQYRLPVSPGLRIWIAMGGYTQFSRDDRNVSLDYWQENMSTQRMPQPTVTPRPV